MMNFTPLNITKPSVIPENPTAILSQKPTPIIKKEIKYNKLKKMIREGKYISARITAKAIGVNKDTVLDWLKTPSIQKEAIKEINESVQVMKKSEDWRSHDRLIQYAIGQDDKTGTGTGNNILIINNGKEYRIEENQS
jgi:hypothetical protein